ncbi:unnamed protein product [Effrenium voratum]|nr:unnamed protein product [Effrenium voratum]
MMPALVEFPNALGPGVPLFVQCAWHSEAAQAPQAPDGAPDAVPAPEGLCHLVMIDGNQCWVGTLQQKDLAGPLGDSWKDPANLRLLREALSSPPESLSPSRLPGPRAEAAWRVVASELEVTVRFIYREGPVAAVQAARFPAVSLDKALGDICSGIRKLQSDVQSQASSVQAEKASLLARQEVLKRQLELLPEEVEAHEARLLDGLSGVLNAQKRRCLSLAPVAGGGGGGREPGPQLLCVPHLRRQRRATGGAGGAGRNGDRLQHPADLGHEHGEPWCQGPKRSKRGLAHAFGIAAISWRCS